MLPMNHVPTIRPSPARKRLAGKNIASALDVDIAGTPSQTHLARSGAHHRRDEDLSSSTTLGPQPVANPPCWASETAVRLNLTIPCLRQWPGRDAGLAPAPPGVRTGRHTDEGRPARRPVTRGGRRRRSARAARLGHARDARGDPGLHRHALRGLYHAVEHFAMHTGQIIWIAKARTGRDLGFCEIEGGVALPR